MNKWKRMPDDYGPHWFTVDLKDRDLAVIVFVDRRGSPEHGDVTFHRADYRWDRYQKKIESYEGWWLKIDDHRRVAEVEE